MFLYIWYIYIDGIYCRPPSEVEWFDRLLSSTVSCSGGPTNSCHNTSLRRWSRTCAARRRRSAAQREREFVIDNLLDRIHFIIVMIRWTSLAPWEFEFPFPGSLTCTFLVCHPPSDVV